MKCNVEWSGPHNNNNAFLFSPVVLTLCNFKHVHAVTPVDSDDQ